MRISEENYLKHYGILRKSGRYPWGSGSNPNQRSKSFLDMIDDLRKNHGMSNVEIAKAFSREEHPFTTTDLVRVRSIASNLQKQEQIRTVQQLEAKGMSKSAIARQMGLNESTVRSLLEPGRLQKLNVLQNTADMLKREVAEKEFLDIGAYTELDLPIGDNPETRIGISKDKFRTAVAMLKEEGYGVHEVPIPQVGTGENTNTLVLTKPGVTQKEAWRNRGQIRPITEKTEDGGDTYHGLKPPLEISSKRVGIRYKEDGGADADGVIFVRPGVKDISLGKGQYAQVRISIEGTHYLKGMAIYKDDLPKGVDLLFNTNKSDTGNKFDAMKEMKMDIEGKVDPVNPFGAAIKIGGQIQNDKGNVTSAMNLINEQGDWDTWSKNLSRQVLSKQEPSLATSQLALTYDRRRAEFDEIKSLTNPVIRKKLLETFSNETDSAAVDLKAVYMPKQATKVLLPSNHVKPNEIFAPSFRDGDRVVLIRFPHAGTFEIPELTVNSRSRKVREMFGELPANFDAVVIHPKVAERLSGADFDGDAVVVIPNNRKLIKNREPLEDLKNFDPQFYKVEKDPATATKEHPKGLPTIDDSRKQNEMGIVTNLISDMTVKGASWPEIAKAVKHSMVVIDSEKHNLDFKASERDHGIRELKIRYQGQHERGNLKGAATLITRATAPEHVFRRKARLASEGGPIDPATGKKVFTDTGQVNVKYKDADGNKIAKPFASRELAEKYVQEHGLNAKIELRTIKSKKLAETDDAFTLMSEGRGTTIEKVYAAHSNKLKDLANEARKEMVHTTPLPRSSSAAKVYAPEVESLNAKLRIAQKNAPLERQAQAVAGQEVGQRIRANPHMDGDTKKKIKGQALREARLRTGAGKHRIKPTTQEWEAIQAGAISKTMLENILKNSDIKHFRQLATPRKNTVMTSALTTRAKQMLASGYTPSEVADALGVALSTLKSSVAEEVS